MQQDVPAVDWERAINLLSKRISAMNERMITLNQKIQELREALDYHMEYGPHVPEEGIPLG